mgnify:FL=1
MPVYTKQLLLGNSKISGKKEGGSEELAQDRLRKTSNLKY